MARTGQRCTLAWEGDRSEGWQRAWLRTVKEVSFAPAQSLRDVGPGDVRTALSFGGVSQCLGYLFYLPFHFGVVLMDPTLDPEQRSGVLSVAVILLLTLPFWVMLDMVLKALLMHPFLRLVGGGGDLRATLRASGYASGPHALYAVPCVGPLVGAALSIVSHVHAQKYAHGVSGPQVIVAWVLAVGVVGVVLGASGVLGALAALGPGVAP